MSKGIGGNCLEAISRTFREATGARGVPGAWKRPEPRMGGVVARDVPPVVAWGGPPKRAKEVVAWKALSVVALGGAPKRLDGAAALGERLKKLGGAVP